MSDPRNHIVISRVDVNPRRHKPQIYPRVRDRENVSHGKKLQANIDKILENDRKSKPQPIMDPVHVIRLKYDNKISEDTLRRAGIEYLEIEPEKRVIVLSDDGLETFQQQLKEYSQKVPEGVNPSYKSLMAALEPEMENTTSKDRIGQKLEKINISPDQVYKLDVEIWVREDHELNLKRVDQFQEFIRNNDGRILDHHIGTELLLFRISISGRLIDALVNDPNIKNVDLPPQPDNSATMGMRTSLPDLTVDDSPSEDAAGICVIDSGILVQHPLLSASIGYTKEFHTNLRNGIDENGHGTLVAGIALYGDIHECIRNLTFSPSIVLYGARVLNADNRFDDEKLVVTQMEEAIKYFHKEFNCRVFNISIADPDQVYRGKKPSPWAHMLDLLATELDIIIVVAAGNYNLATWRGDDADRIYSSYPKYIVDGAEHSGDTKILEPATATNVLTVGSLAHSTQSFIESRYPNDLNIAVAKDDMPSPFTRSGPGVNNAIKPDVCEYGGNMLWRGRPTSISSDPQLGIISTQLDYRTRLFGSNVGTSFATPKISHLAATILNYYPSASANLVRALIANSAVIPEALNSLVDDNKLSSDDVLQICGNGKPSKHRALHSDETRVTLFADETSELDTIHIYEIPIPQEFQELGTDRKISVTLAFDPPTRRTRYDYLGIMMDFRLFRGLDLQQIVDKYAERTVGEDPDDFPKKHQCSMIPSPRRRQFSTLQKGTWIAKRDSNFVDYENGRVFHLLVRCFSRWASETEYPRQRYAVTVTIEYDDGMIDLHNLVKNEIRVRDRSRVRG